MFLQATHCGPQSLTCPEVLVCKGACSWGFLGTPTPGTTQWLREGELLMNSTMSDVITPHGLGTCLNRHQHRILGEGFFLTTLSLLRNLCCLVLLPQLVPETVASTKEKAGRQVPSAGIWRWNLCPER